MEKKRAVRAKVVDDRRRDRSLLAAGKFVLPLMKEDLYEHGMLDEVTQQLLQAANTYFEADTRDLEACLRDPEQCRDRFETLCALRPQRFGG